MRNAWDRRPRTSKRSTSAHEAHLILSHDSKALTLGQLWTVKYAPKSMKDVCGNKGILEKMQKWLESWFVCRSMVIESLAKSNGQAQELEVQL